MQASQDKTSRPHWTKVQYISSQFLDNKFHVQLFESRASSTAKHRLGAGQ